VIPFPLPFAKQLAHRGVEELRFPPGFMDAKSDARWSYAFAWRLDDPAKLDAAALAGELTAYFRGLLTEVDGDKHRFAPDEIAVRATADGDRFTLTAHIFDAFGDAAPIDLAGDARRTPCGEGSLWTFVLAPANSARRAQLDTLGGQAACGQPPVK